ncbi:ABC transporter ATP-binding protein [Polynucleobacter sp. TUM22923]|uniref:ABC transporter ATP-binding protein n=1 Tax=Polynucleobacter sp. TUM22923 TaxID=3022126 RepID=UPI0025747F9E|nr:ABC transporter ATP-binding protein [Polynucleobacter sp. TUM22923]BDX22500.1 ABC transporter ATP-binding protein [Polynucleobacter sp. TUM22923]
MSSDIAIKVSNLSKCYQIYEQPHDRLKQSIYPRLQRLAGKQPKQYFREFWALKDVSFEIKKGETVGIIGRNGSGKSTLLQMICGTLNPTSGSIQTNGRIAALLELGSGFNPEFTGRENVYMNAAIIGLSREETEARFDDIIAFADIGDFIEQPVKTYSSGMYVRLAFAVIAHVDADILVVDEALAVGDTFFTQKCMRFIRQFQMNGGTLLLVSHDMATMINICQSAVMLFAGGQRRAITGSAEALCKDYLNQIYDDPTRHEQVEQQRSLHAQSSQRENARTHKVLKGAAPEINAYAVSDFRADAEHFGKGGVTIIDAGFFDEDRNRLTTVIGGQPVCFIVSVRANQPVLYPAVGLMVKDRLGQYLYTEGTDKTFRHHQLAFEAGERIDTIFHFTMPLLLRGQYTINVAIAEGMGDEHIQHHWMHDTVKIESISGPVVHGIGGLLNSDITMEFFP